MERNPHPSNHKEQIKWRSLCAHFHFSLNQRRWRTKVKHVHVYVVYALFGYLICWHMCRVCWHDNNVFCHWCQYTKVWTGMLVNWQVNQYVGKLASESVYTKFVSGFHLIWLPVGNISFRVSGWCIPGLYDSTDNILWWVSIKTKIRSHFHVSLVRVKNFLEGLV